MKTKVYLLLLITTIASCSQNDKSNVKVIIEANALSSIDGPYIYDYNDSLEIVSVKHSDKSSFVIEKTAQLRQENQLFSCEVSNQNRDVFLFNLSNNYSIPEHKYKATDKIFVTSDIEGNFNSFYSLLVGNNIMDKNYNWIFGDGHLVVAGDMMDKGNNVIPCLWLLYKLEQDAKKQNGHIHFILGNHDIMTIQLDIRYVRSKYIELAKIVSGETDEKVAYKYLMSNNNELIKWIKSKNAIEKIGNNLFLHGGISPEVVDANLSIKDINTALRKHLHELFMSNPEDNDVANLVLSRKGPLWYRGLVRDYNEHYKKVSLEDLDKILNFYNVEHIIIGHTHIDNEVTSDFNGKVIRLDIKHPKEKFSGKSQALLIEHNKYYKVNDLGTKTKLF